MGDFLLALGPADDRALGRSAEFLRFYPDIRVDRFAYPEFSLLVTSADDPQLWAPFVSPGNSLFVAVLLWTRNNGTPPPKSQVTGALPANSSPEPTSLPASPASKP
jgi:hypothetical protein